MKKTLALAALAMGVFCAAASAQTYPTKPVKLLVGFAAGGPTDVIARILAQDLTGTLGQTVLVENKAGAVSMILYADKRPYDPIADFTPISLVCYLPLLVVASWARVIKAANVKPE